MRMMNVVVKSFIKKNKRLGAIIHNDAECWIRTVQKHNKSYTGLGHVPANSFKNPMIYII